MSRGISREDSGKVLVDCIIQTAKLLSERGVEKKKAIIIGQELAQFLARHWSGSAVYFSAKGLSYRLVAAELAKDFDGSRGTILALVRKHNVSETFIYATLKRLREQQKDSGK